jgi:Spy/CpxP family protein refolding chaperone
MRNRFLSLAALALAISAPAAWAQRGPGGPGRMGGPNAACRQGPDSLSDTQKAQVRTLGDAFIAAHKVQLDSLRAIMEAARAARQAGETQDQIRAIMDQGMAINEELAPARKDYHEAVVKLLTAQQVADGCIPPAPGSGPPPGGRRGGPPPQ